MNDQDRIKQRAHEIWESEGRPEGRDAEHWSRAEEELRNQLGDDAGNLQGRADGDDSLAGSIDQQPELEQTVAPATPKKGRKTTKSKAKPYLNDGP